ncbi:hypothetical protein DIPPA_13196 [Diplonema papillatum]|nr:hypothetical protein DIPPA_13196 [Diplonema papillatum]
MLEFRGLGTPEATRLERGTRDLDVDSAAVRAEREVGGKAGRGPVRLAGPARFRALKRQGALRPQKQALPATEEDVTKAIVRERYTDTKLALALVWRGAARVADVTGLKAGDVTRQKGYLAINWSDTKSDPFKLGVTTGIVLPEHLDSILEKRLRRKAPQDRLLATSCRRMSAAREACPKGSDFQRLTLRASHRGENRTSL